ncbi:MAG: noncanonical pyrimidine nucleotidase, YjjG family [Ruminococcaceae bacterium]|nr:noncanonical pyrimidine nucleotidase, YjjG family [Oscillospiraceae bacterium]
MVKVILWDIDGTLLNFKMAEKASIRTCFEVFGLGKCTDEMIERYSIINDRYWKRLEKGEITKAQVLAGRFEEFFALEGITFSDVDGFNREYQFRLGDNVYFNDNGYNVVKQLKGQVKQYAVTNGTFTAQERKLSKSGLDMLFDGVFISEKLGAEKPGISFFEAIWEKIGRYNRDEVMIVGDSLSSDIQGGNNADILCCWYNPEKKKKPENLRIDYDIQSLEEVMGIVDRRCRLPGSAEVYSDAVMPYPRLCAHCGFHTIAPENSFPALGAAVALGAAEIEFDIRPTKDGKVVCIHDSHLDELCNGTGMVWDYTLEELKQFDFGKGFDGAYAGMRLPAFEEVLQQFGRRAVMNIHVKSVDNVNPIDEGYLRHVVELIRQYHCEKYVYFMTGNNAVLQQLAEIAPEISRCVGGGDEWDTVVERAIRLGCQKVQFVKGYFSREKIELAHSRGIRCNVYWSNDPEEADQYLDMGIDTILTDDYQRMVYAVGERIAAK